MSDLTYFLLKIGLLVLMWLFVAAVAGAIRSDLFGPKVRVLTAPAKDNSGTPAIKSATVATPETATTLRITAGPRTGAELVLGTEPITIGRSPESGLILRDDYISNNHARLYLRDGAWTIEDQASTNGTYVNGERITAPTRIALGVPVQIGTTIFELKK